MMQFLSHVFRMCVCQTTLLFFLFIVPLSGKAQLKDSLEDVIENGHIGVMNNYLGIRASMGNGAEAFTVITPGGPSIELYPNTVTYAHFGFNYRFISGGFRITPDFLPGNGDTETKGRTKEFSLGMELFFRHFFQTIRYSSVRGYYLYNTKDYNPLWKEGDRYIQFPDLKYTGFEGSSGYAFNPRLSLKALATQTDRQLKSAGSFIIRSRYRYYIINDKSEATPNRTTQRSDNFEITLGIGYTYVLVIKKSFYVSVGLTPYIGYLYSSIKTDYYTSVQHGHQHNRITGVDGRFAVGYNGRSFFAGCNLNVEGQSYRQQHTSVYNNDAKATYQIFVGFRFKPFKLIKEQVDFLQKQMDDHVPAKKSKN